MRNVLLTVGGVLLGIAAIVFTVISWGSLGMGARAGILLSFTAVALGAVWPLVRRGLAATGETVATVGLLLLGLQCYAAYAGDLFGLGAIDGRWYATGAVLAVSLGWGAYGWAAPLRLPVPMALVLGQGPLLLAANAMDASIEGIALVLVVLSLLDLGVMRMAPRETLVRGVAGATGIAVGLTGTGIALAMSFDSVEAAWVLIAASLMALVWARCGVPDLAVAFGLAAAAGLGGVLPLDDRWAAAGYAVAAAIVLLGAGSLRHPVSKGAGVVLAVAGLASLPAAFVSLTGPSWRLEDVWSGELIVLPVAMRELVVPSAPIVLAVLALGVALVRLAWAPPVVALAVLTTSVSLELAYPVSLVAAVAVAVLLGAWAAFAPVARVGAGVSAAVVALWAAIESLATQDATLAVLGALTIFGLVVGLLERAIREGAVAIAVLSLGGFAATLGSVAGLTEYQASLGVLAAAAVGLAVAMWARGVLVEVMAWTLAASAVVMAGDEATPLSLNLAIAGVLAFAVASRPDRRKAVWFGSALMLLSWWIRLVEAQVAEPEAYTVPISVALVAVGLLRRRREPELSSWTAYGPALSATLLPSLLAAWADTSSPRPMLLAVAAFAITAVGARARLRAPLMLGGAVLVLDAGRQLAPYAAEAVAQLPGWFPIALIGLVTLALGATYEQRLRDLRRVREAVSRLD
ncbi:SCO7613 C-terminal domain-containing membrane protein [Spirillospora sp. CA-294931]|uniref:SCO7613 C-terminal domain-containing membrane protein n=1 Tax=Spirillospora sp. CA-294931 TaxID=3240042 RepID=UPI003D89EED6